MQNFIHKAGTQELEISEHDGATTIGEIAVMHGGADALIFINDNDKPTENDLTLDAAGVGAAGHIHVAHCRRVTATVNFKEDSKSHEFPPNVAMHAVFEWAAGPKGYKLEPTDKAEHMLVVAGTETPVDEDTHLESYVVGDDCGAEFDLVPKHRFEG
jgi:hypothetical protein